MNERWVFGTTMFAAIGAGVVAGVFLAFSTFLMQTLDKRPAPEAITTMNTINDKIENPLFLLAFAGTALAGVVPAGYALFSVDGPERIWLVAGGATYLIGAVLVTAAYHIPRNDALNKVDPTSTEAAAKWSDYFSEWMPVHHIRTLAAVVSTFCFIMAIRVG